MQTKLPKGALGVAAGHKPGDKIARHLVHYLICTILSDTMSCKQPFPRSQVINGTTFEWNVPCGQCMPCRIRRRDEWAGRILLESLCHDHSVFVTLTYDPEHLPDADKYPGGNLVKEDLQKFIKRFRKSIEPQKVRYFGCGEYGEKSQRAHYHLVVFGIDLLSANTRINETWQKGYCSVSELNPTRARYVAKYTTKRLTLPGSFSDGRASEFSTMSRKPGLGAQMPLKWSGNVKRWKSFVGFSLLDESDPNATWNTLIGSFRYQGKKYPLDLYMQEQFLKVTGIQSPTSSEIRKAVWRDMKTVRSALDMDLAQKTITKIAVNEKIESRLNSKVIYGNDV